MKAESTKVDWNVVNGVVREERTALTLSKSNMILKMRPTSKYTVERSQERSAACMLLLMVIKV